MVVDAVNWWRVWFDCRPQMVRLCSRPEVHMEPDEIYNLLRDGRGQLFHIDGCAWAVLEYVGDAVHVVGVVGDGLKKGWEADFTDFLHHACTEMGVSRATLIGRKGWLRRLKNIGWRPTGGPENEMEVLWAA